MAKPNKLKFDNCKDCHSQCEHAGKDRKFVCVNGVSCKIVKEKPTTNADRIRAMSDEELTEHEVRITQDEMYYECSDGEIFAIYEDAIAYERAWLQQPAEEDSNDPEEST